MAVNVVWPMKVMPMCGKDFICWQNSACSYQPGSAAWKTDIVKPMFMFTVSCRSLLSSRLLYEPAVWMGSLSEGERAAPSQSTLHKHVWPKDQPEERQRPTYRKTFKGPLVPHRLQGQSWVFHPDLHGWCKPFISTGLRKHLLDGRVETEIHTHVHCWGGPYCSSLFSTSWPSWSIHGPLLLWGWTHSCELARCSLSPRSAMS